jgi:hypothetical protein
MTEDDLAAHLGSHHRDTLHKIFEHPTSHNIEWHAVVSLLEAVGSVETRRDNKVEVHVGTATGFFDVPKHKDVDIDTVADLRRLLATEGYDG